MMTMLTMKRYHALGTVRNKEMTANKK